MMRTALLTLALVGLCNVNSASANLVFNGSFEAPSIPTGSYSYLGAIPGWTLDTGPAIEIQNNVAGSPFDGQQFVELDSSANSSIYQDLSTVVGQTYELSFAYSPRPGIDANSTGIDISWGGALVTNLDLTGVGLSNTAWQVYTYDLTATSTTTRLEFAATGNSDSFGGYIDAVSVSPVPEPSSLALCGFAGVIGLAVARFRRKRAA
jgi:hypothetical protein